jgi:hypothetical protein
VYVTEEITGNWKKRRNEEPCDVYCVQMLLALRNTSHTNTNEMQLFLFSLFGVRTVHVSDSVCVHYQDHYKL